MQFIAVTAVLQLLIMPLKVLCLVKLKTSGKVGFKASNNFKHSLRLFSSPSKKRVVFLGTPSVAANSLSRLYNASTIVSNSNFELISVVTQPPASAGRNKKLTKSSVHELAEKLKLPVFYPQNAKDVSFLESLEGMNVDLFITAAYGNYLPKRFLNIAKFGTINIHPSLLPKYRGAAPVQRCLENGDLVTGVTVLYSVAKMDAGPILYQQTYPLRGDETSTQVLDECFALGTQALINLLPAIFDGTAKTTEQDDANAISAPKINITEGLIDFADQTALQIHNKCRAFSDWPGTYAFFSISQSEKQRVKIVTTKILDSSCPSIPFEAGSIGMTKENNQDFLAVRCKDKTMLGVLELQPASKKVMNAKAFLNGLQGQLDIKWLREEANK